MKYEVEMWLLPRLHAHERKCNAINKKKVNPLKSKNHLTVRVRATF